jgi:ABC-type sugar transport system ATPase subunit
MMPLDTHLTYALPVIADARVYAAAVDLLDQYGEDAPLEASAVADGHERAGDMVATAFWRAVEQATQIVLMDEPLGEVH